MIAHCGLKFSNLFFENYSTNRTASGRAEVERREGLDGFIGKAKARRKPQAGNFGTESYYLGTKLLIVVDSGAVGLLRLFDLFKGAPISAERHKRLRTVIFKKRVGASTCDIPSLVLTEPALSLSGHWNGIMSLIPRAGGGVGRATVD